MSLRLFNTMTRTVEPLVPVVPGRVTLYTCGPTIWNYAHIGNFRTFVFEDLLRRWLIASGFEVYQVMNLTDVDDRIIGEAGKKGVPIREFTSPFAEAFHADRNFLRIQDAEEYPRATDFIEPMVRLIEGLLANGVAYRGDDGSIYFSIERFPAYGRLSQLDKRELKTGASSRVASDEYAKEDARDFALWKAAKPEDEAVGAVWDAPFGRGRPGWHLECSAMALELIGRKYGATVLDIHAGGVDLIFPHHEDEIAQSCAFTGEADFARIWMHGEFLNVRGQKMSKRYGNYTTPRDLREDGVDPGAIRLLFFQTHYRQKLDLTDEALAAAREGARRLGGFARRLEDASGQGAEAAEFVALAQKLETGFREALNDDLNAPRAIAAAFDFVSEGNRLLDQGTRPGERALAAWRLVDTVLDASTKVKFTTTGSVTVGVSAALALPEAPPGNEDEAMVWAGQWAEARVAAKAKRDFGEADRIRKLLADHGFEVRDSRTGSEVVRK
jgi:cysteinyl-tRNA synthetase